MGKIIFGSYIADEDITIKENLGPFVASVQIATIETLFDTSYKFKEIRESDDIWLINTKISPIPGTGMAIVSGNKVKIMKCPI